VLHLVTPTLGGYSDGLITSPPATLNNTASLFWVASASFANSCTDENEWKEVVVLFYLCLWT